LRRWLLVEEGKEEKEEERRWLSRADGEIASKHENGGKMHAR